MTELAKETVYQLHQAYLIQVRLEQEKQELLEKAELEYSKEKKIKDMMSSLLLTGEAKRAGLGVQELASLNIYETRRTVYLDNEVNLYRVDACNKCDMHDFQHEIRLEEYIYCNISKDSIYVVCPKSYLEHFEADFVVFEDWSVIE